MNTKQQWNKIYEAIDYDYFEQSDVKFTKQFLIKCKKQFNETNFIPVEVKKNNKLVLSTVCFYKFLKLNGHLFAEPEKSWNKKKNPKSKF